MREYQQNFFWRNLLYSKWIIFFLLFLILFLINKTFDIYLKYSETKQNLFFSQKEESKLLERLNSGQDKIKNIETNYGQEKYIKEIYPVKKEDEEVIIIYNLPPITYAIPEDKTWWLEIKEWYNKITK